jgi:hypothetical protein
MILFPQSIDLYCTNELKGLELSVVSFCQTQQLELIYDFIFCMNKLLCIIRCYHLHIPVSISKSSSTRNTLVQTELALQ